jgi:hypothetical protein
MNRRLTHFGGTRALNPFFGSQVEVPVILGDRAVPVDVRILRAYLPKLLKSSALTYDATIDVNQLIWRSENVQKARVRQGIMRNTLHKLIHSLVGEVQGSGGPQLRLMSFLERTLHRQQMPYHRVIFGETYQYFASLSEISRVCNSERIAHILEQFFSKHGSQIAEQESTHGMFDWARAILRSNMKEAALCMCLREILTVRPNFDEEMERITLRSGSQFAMQLIQNIQDTLARMTHSDFEPMDRGRGIFRRGGGAIMHRRYATSPYRYRIRLRRPMIAMRAFSNGIVPTRGSLGVYDDRTLVRQTEARRLHQIKRQMDHFHHRQRNIEEALGEVADRADAALQVSTAAAAFSDDEDFGGIASNWGDHAWD